MNIVTRQHDPSTPFSLTNDGQLEIFFLGVGSQAAVRNYQTNFIIVKGDTHIFVDLGATAIGPGSLHSVAGLTPYDVGCILPTHCHSDHVGGIDLIHTLNRYVGIPLLKKEKLRMVISEDFQRVLWGEVLQGGSRHNERDGMGRNLQFSDYYVPIRPVWKEFSPREIREVNVGPIHLEMFRTKHVPNNANSWEDSFISYGIMIDGKVLYSGDTRFDPELIELYGHDAELVFHDAGSDPVHANIKVEGELKSLPDDIKARTFLVHYGDWWEGVDITGFAGWAEQGVSYILQ